MSGILTTVPKSLLRLVSDQIQLDGVENYDPDRFYRSRSGLSVAQDFMPAVLWKARSSETKTLGPISLSSYEITESVKDDNLITSAFGGNHTFDEFELCARIEQMIRKQPDGEAGDLLNKAHMDMNQFYTSSCMVRLCWRAYIYNEWQLSVWKLGDHAYQGCRVFSRN